MFIQETQIMEIAGKRIFVKGKEYYEDGYVGDFDIDLQDSNLNSKDKKINIRTNVISSNIFNRYNIRLQWEGDLKEIRSYCSCQMEHKTTMHKGLCTHIIAVLLKYIHEYQTDIFNFVEETEIDNLLGAMKVESYFSNDYKRELNMDVKFVKEGYKRSFVELKVGLERLYVVKSMKEFLNAVYLGEKLELGKKFTYEPMMQKFKEYDDKLIDMFIEIAEINGEYSWRQDFYDSHYSSLISAKKLFLTDKLIYKFFHILREKNINIEVEGREYKEIKIIEAMLPLKFILSFKNDNIELTHVDEYPIPIDDSYRIFLFGEIIYLIPMEQSKIYGPLYNNFFKKKDRKLYFDKYDGQKVASYLIPMLKKIAKEVDIDTSIKEYFYETPLLIQTYLDKEDELITALVRFNYDKTEIDPLKEIKVLQNEKVLIRDIVKEEKYKQVLKSYGFQGANEQYIMMDEKNIMSFITEGMVKLQDLSEVYYSDSFRKIKMYNKFELKGGVKINDQNLLEFSFNFEDIDKNELRDIFNAVKEKKKYYRLKNGSFVRLEDNEIRDIVSMFDFLNIKDKDVLNEKVMISKYNALYVDTKIKEKNMDGIIKSKDFQSIVNKIENINSLDFYVPNKLDKIMRNYQKNGCNWLRTLANCGFGGILADEMGLGKTLQTIAFLTLENGELPSIIIVPTSLVYNWKSEIEKFAPELKTKVICGCRKEREEQIKNIRHREVVITSYSLIRRDIDDYQEIDFNYCIIDEAQQIKNPMSINATTVKEIKARGYFALTGTPIENSLTELWSIFDFIMPGYLFNHSKFTTIYETPILRDNNKVVLDELIRHISPFILRRLKSDVMNELPPKIEQKLVVEMTDEQKKLYVAYLNSAKAKLNDEIRVKGFKRSKLKVIAILTRLRQICCDPSIFIENYNGDSGKMLALDYLLEKTILQGHKVLLFSQFTSVLENIGKRLDKNKIQFMYLNGSTKSEDRVKMVRKFNEGETKIFLISIKAGGTGLNLESADVVIHFDPWWNPAVEEQATDRAHRIGQRKTVEVIKLLSQGTIEEKILNLQEKKREIIRNVMDSNVNEENVIFQMTEEDLESLFAN